MADAQREIAALEVKRNNAQAWAAQLERTQPLVTGPIEAFAARRSPQAQAWLKRMLCQTGMEPTSRTTRGHC